MTEKETLEFDLVIVGAGPAGLSAAIRAAQLSNQNNLNWSIAVIEKASQVGGHILSGAVMDAKALNELLPDWLDMDAPIEAKVEGDSLFHLTHKTALPVPNGLLPAGLHNKNHYLIRLSSLVRWLATQAESLGVEILTSFAAHQLLMEEDKVIGIATGDMGVNKHGEPKNTYTPGYHLLARHTLLAEGCRGHLGKQVIQQFGLDTQSNPPHYGLGFKEVWQLQKLVQPAGTVWHTIGHPLSDKLEGGGFVYFLKENQVALGLIVSLNYANPHLDPFAEFNRWKHHSKISALLNDAQRIAYGARSVNKGGLYSLPQATFPGGMLLGCDAGMLNPARIKGIHCAIKHGCIAIESLVESEQSKQALAEVYGKKFSNSWLYKEQYQARNFRGMISRLGTLFGGALFSLEQKLFAGTLPWQWHDKTPDHTNLQPKNVANNIHYPKPDGVISFDRLSSIYLANLDHDEDQPCHLQLTDNKIPIAVNLSQFDEPAQRYCPAGVYEIITNDQGEAEFKINAQNCIHCKTCDIKDPQANITWCTPEGGSGPNYSGL